MSQITISSHDVLSKLSAVKNYLSVTITDVGDTVDPKYKTYLQHAYDANQSLIDAVKQRAAMPPSNS